MDRVWPIISNKEVTNTKRHKKAQKGTKRHMQHMQHMQHKKAHKAPPRTREPVTNHYY